MILMTQEIKNQLLESSYYPKEGKRPIRGCIEISGCCM